MSRTPSLCGEFLGDKRSMVAFVWSVTTVLTIFAFATAIILTVKVHSHYKYLERLYDGDDWYTSYYDYDNSQDEDKENGESHDEKYRDQIRESYLLLSSMSAKSVTFVAIYTMILATALSMYGSMAIVGFTSLWGVYIAPCLPIGPNKLRVGIFGGMIVVFANLLLVCAVILGEIKVNASYDDVEKEEGENMNGEGEPYEVERIANILAVTFIFLSALYAIFAILLFLCHAGEEQSMLRIEQGSGGVGMGSPLNTIGNNIPVPGKTTPLVGVGGKRLQTTTLRDGARGFITMDNSSQGTAE